MCFHTYYEGSTQLYGRPCVFSLIWRGFYAALRVYWFTVWWPWGASDMLAFAMYIAFFKNAGFLETRYF